MTAYRDRMLAGEYEAPQPEPTKEPEPKAASEPKSKPKVRKKAAAA